MKKPIIIISSAILLLAIALSVYLLIGCQKNVEPIKEYSDAIYLENIDFSPSNRLCDIFSNTVENNKASNELEDLQSEFYSISNSEVIDFISNINTDELIQNLKNQFIITTEEKVLMNSGDLNTINSVLQRLSIVPEIFSDSNFVKFLNIAFNNQVFKQYIPIGYSFEKIDTVIFNPVSFYSLHEKSANTIQDGCACCIGCLGVAGGCATLAGIALAASITVATNLYSQCLLAALPLQVIPFVGQALYIAAVATCTAILAYNLYQSYNLYNQAVNTCNSAYNVCISSCHSGGSGS